MSKDNDKKPTINQWAWILNYQPTINEQHIHMEEKTAESQQVTRDDEEKQKRLVATNTVIRTQTQSEQLAIDILKLYHFIEKRFVSEIAYKYEWYALRRFLEKYYLLRDCDNEQFAAQMNNQEWFGACKKLCEANEMNYYNYLNSVHPDQWMETDIPLGGRATKRSVEKMYNTYAHLELYKDQIIS